jgi:hypothetical protein
VLRADKEPKRWLCREHPKHKMVTNALRRVTVGLACPKNKDMLFEGAWRVVRERGE